jgi:hypothetical protein
VAVLAFVFGEVKQHGIMALFAAIPMARVRGEA